MYFARLLVPLPPQKDLDLFFTYQKNNRTMKKLILMAAVAMTAIGFTACNGGGSANLKTFVV